MLELAESWVEFVAGVENCGKEKKSAKGDEAVGSLWALMNCNCCSNSLTKLMAPPIMEAWSPCYNIQIISLEKYTTTQLLNMFLCSVVKLK